MKRTILKAFSVLWLLGMYSVLFITFLSAYHSPEKAVMVTINQSGEAQFELYMLSAGLMMAFMGTLLIIGDIRNDMLFRARPFRH
jgi:hypothetical protein